MHLPALSGIAWRTSSLSKPQGDNCVEVAPVADVIAVRDSKDPHGPVLAFDCDQWAALIGAAKGGALR